MPHVVERGDAVLWAARGEEDGEENWNVLCGEPDHATDDLCLAHMAHLVRSSPALREVSDLALGDCASRADTDAPWVREPI